MLSKETQERIVNSLCKDIVPDTQRIEVDRDTIRHWYANRSILAFWVSHAHLRDPANKGKET